MSKKDKEEESLRRTAGLLFEGPKAAEVSNFRLFDRAFDAAYESYQSTLDFWTDDFEIVEVGEDEEPHWVHKETGTKIYLVGD